MAQEIKVAITLEDGKDIKPFTFFTVRQELGEHDYFTIEFPIEIIEGSSSFILNDAKKYIGTIVSISMMPLVGEGAENNFKGLITDIQLTTLVGSFDSLVFSGYSPTILLEGGNNLKSFSETNIKKIVSEITKVIPSNVVSLSNNPKSSTAIPYIVQYNESDYNFLKRIALQYGEWFYYDGSNLIFGTPKESKSEEIELTSYGPDESLKMKITSLNFISNQYNYMDKACTMGMKWGLSGLNPMSQYAYSKADKMFPNAVRQQSVRPVTEPKDMDELVNAQLAESAASFVQLNGKTEIPSLKLGSLVSVILKNEQNKKEDAGSFRIIEIFHFSDGMGNYENKFVAIPEKIEVPPVKKHNIVFPKCESQPAIVTDNKDPEGLGRVKVKMFWQQDSGTPWLRMVHPHAGNDKGFYFIPEIDEEVMVGFEHGNPDAPYVIGAMYNGKEKSNWKQDKNYLKAIKTISGNMIWFNDEGGKEEIKIVNKDAQNEISLTLQKNGLITIKAKDKILFDAPHIEMKCKELKIDAQDKIETKTKATTIESQQKTELKALEIAVKATKDLKMEAAMLDVNASATGKIASAKLEVSGSAMLELKGGAMAKLQGGIVMIN